MSSNSSSINFVTISPLDIPSEYVYLAFTFGLLIYLIIVFCNLLVLSTIAGTKKLHKPMFILLLNLPISDLTGATAFFPFTLYNIVTQNRLITPQACVTQAFFIHLYGAGNQIVLSAMAYDRYIAICCPLKYHVKLNPRNLMKIVFSIWFLDTSLLLVSFMLVSRYKFCKFEIYDIYCNLPSLGQLICGDTTSNNYYGLFTIVALMGCPLAIILYTYVRILVACIIKSNAHCRRKAFQTCCTHLFVFLVFQINTDGVYILYRSQSKMNLLRRGFLTSIVIFPPFFNPIIYGINTRELRQSILLLFRRKSCFKK